MQGVQGVGATRAGGDATGQMPTAAWSGSMLPVLTKAGLFFLTCHIVFLALAMLLAG